MEIPAIKENRKVKSMQMFRQPVEKATQGDRLGLCVTQFEPKLLERGLVAVPNFIPTIYAGIIDMNQIRFYQTPIKTKAKFHVSIGHETVLAKVTLFSGQKDFDQSADFEYVDEIVKEVEGVSDKNIFALLEFERPVIVIPSALVIGSKLDMNVHTSTCRLAFWGHLIKNFEDKAYVASALPELKIFKRKSKVGLVERAASDSSVIVKNMFKKETNLQLFANMKVRLSTGENGFIEGGFGQSGKVKISIPGTFIKQIV